MEYLFSVLTKLHCIHCDLIISVWRLTNHFVGLEYSSCNRLRTNRCYTRYIVVMFVFLGFNVAQFEGGLYLCCWFMRIFAAVRTTILMCIFLVFFSLLWFWIFFFETFVQMMITHVEHGNKQIVTSTLSWTIWWLWASVNKQHNRKFVHYIWPGCSVQSAKFINRAHRYHFEFLIPFFAISSNPFEVFFPEAHKKVHGQSM